MAKGPGLYSDIGKKTRDFLYQDYQSNEHKVTVTTHTCNRSAITYTGTHKGDLYLGEMTAKLKNGYNTTDIKVDTNLNLWATQTVDFRPRGGLKLITSFIVPDQESCKMELQYLNECAGISCGLAGPFLNFSAVAGNDALSLGGEMSFEIGSGKITKCNAGLNFSKSDLAASLALNDKGDTVTASYYHNLNSLTSTSVGAEITQSLSSQKNSITIGMQHALDPQIMVKAKVNNQGKASALIQHQWLPNTLFSISGEVDTRAVEKSAKIGLALALKHDHPRNLPTLAFV